LRDSARKTQTFYRVFRFRKTVVENRLVRTLGIPPAALTRRFRYMIKDAKTFTILELSENEPHAARRSAVACRCTDGARRMIQNR
jgi:hypothetical protein